MRPAGAHFDYRTAIAPDLNKLADLLLVARMGFVVELCFVLQRVAPPVS